MIHCREKQAYKINIMDLLNERIHCILRNVYKCVFLDVLNLFQFSKNLKRHKNVGRVKKPVELKSAGKSDNYSVKVVYSCKDLVRYNNFKADLSIARGLKMLCRYYH